MGRPDRHHRGEPRLGTGGRPLADRLRHVGDRLQVRGRHRARARSRRDARRPARGQRAAVRHRSRGAGQAAGGAHRPERAHLSDDGLLQRAGRRGDGRRRRSAALLRRRLPGQQGARRAPLLARAGDGGRVPGRGALRGRRGSRRRQHHHPRPRRRRRTARGGGGSGGDAHRARRDPALPGRHRSQRQQGRLPLQRPGCLDQRVAVPHAACAGPAHRRAAGRGLGAGDRHRRPDPRGRARRHGARPRGRRRGGGQPGDGRQLRRQPGAAPHRAARPGTRRCATTSGARSR